MANKSKLLYWLAIIVIAAALVFFLATRVFPEMVAEIGGFIAGLLAVVTGLFLKRRK
ncbi:MAG: hypothetical protein R2792_04730 [Saprospiraceae bacterium]